VLTDIDFSGVYLC